MKDKCTINIHRHFSLKPSKNLIDSNDNFTKTRNYESVIFVTEFSPIDLKKIIFLHIFSNQIN